jgi:hypothetical protein
MLFVDPDPEADLQTLDFDTENIHKDGKRFFFFNKCTVLLLRLMKDSQDPNSAERSCNS